MLRHRLEKNRMWEVNASGTGERKGKHQTFTSDQYLICPTTSELNGTESSPDAMYFHMRISVWMAPLSSTSKRQEKSRSNAIDNEWTERRTRISDKAKLVMKTFVTVCMALLRHTTPVRERWIKEHLDGMTEIIERNTYRQQVHCRLCQRRRSRHTRKWMWPWLGVDFRVEFVVSLCSEGSPVLEQIEKQYAIDSSVEKQCNWILVGIVPWWKYSSRI